VTEFSRRDALKVGAIGAAAAVSPVRPSEAQMAHGGRTAPTSGTEGAEGQRADHTLFFFNDEEARFVEAAVDRLIPADDWAGAKEAGVLYYIDRQLAAAYGVGARMYLKGPWVPDAPAEQGYQLRYSPAELYRIGIAESRSYVRGEFGDKELWELAPEQIDRVLSALESGDASLPSIRSPVFFETLLANTVEGYFADPVYGGNRDMVSWRMIGFPGAFAQYLELVDQHGYVYDRPPIGIAGALATHHHGMAAEK
jgi:gluconate 2-dehydrogenase gamma chain